MREILFRGKGIYTNEWHEGFLYIGISGACEILETHEYFAVIPETVGQYTGLKDKNGTKIFEGDIVKATDKYDKSVIYFVEYKNGAFMLKQKGVEYHIYFNDLPSKYYCLEVIGNIHEV